MRAKVIKTESEYEAALARIEKLMDAKLNTTQGDELELLSLLVHDYEEKMFPVSTSPTPITAIRFHAWSSKASNRKIWFHFWGAEAESRKFSRDGANFPSG